MINKKSHKNNGMILKINYNKKKKSIKIMGKSLHI